MQASFQRSADPVQSERDKIFTDFLWIGATIFVAALIGRFLFTSTADEIVGYFEDEKNVAHLAITVIVLVVLFLYGCNFYYHKRYEILVDLALDYFSAGRNNVLLVRSSFSWLQNLLSVVQPGQQTCMYMNVAFKYFFQFSLLLLVSVIGSFLCTGREMEYLTTHFVVLGIYYVLAFSQDGASFERIIGHVSYTLLHLGTLFSNLKYNEVSYICINSGFVACLLCMLWYFVNVPMNAEATRRRRRT